MENKWPFPDMNFKLITMAQKVYENFRILTKIIQFIISILFSQLFRRLKFNFKINPLFVFKIWKKIFPIRDSESWVHFTVIKYHFEPHQVHNYVSPHRQRLGLVPMSLIFIAVWWVCGYVVASYCDFTAEVII